MVSHVRARRCSFRDVSVRPFHSSVWSRLRCSRCTSFEIRGGNRVGREHRDHGVGRRSWEDFPTRKARIAREVATNRARFSRRPHDNHVPRPLPRRNRGNAPSRRTSRRSRRRPPGKPSTFERPRCAYRLSSLYDGGRSRLLFPKMSSYEGGEHPRDTGDIPLLVSSESRTLRVLPRWN